MNTQTLTLVEDIQRRISVSALLAEAADTDYRHALNVGRVQGLREALRVIEEHKARHRAQQRK